MRAVTGCDVQPVGDVVDAVERFGDRYLNRIYTAGEQRDCRSPESLAGRFAAKEAVLKLIGTADGVDPRTVEILRGPSGRPAVRLSGRAEQLADAAGVGPIDVAISHGGNLAMAVAVALAHGQGEEHR